MTSQWTSVLVSHSSVVAAVKGHLMASSADRNAVFINGIVLFAVNEVLELGHSTLIEIDDRCNMSVNEKRIYWLGVMG